MATPDLIAASAADKIPGIGGGAAAAGTAPAEAAAASRWAWSHLLLFLGLSPSVRSMPDPDTDTSVKASQEEEGRVKDKGCENEKPSKNKIKQTNARYSGGIQYQHQSRRPCQTVPSRAVQTVGCYPPVREGAALPSTTPVRSRSLYAPPYSLPFFFPCQPVVVAKHRSKACCRTRSDRKHRQDNCSPFLLCYTYS
mmetsp:Transcript_39185/g.103679  ORF Transcript_39185/g.103679 Transcript_39185/m.103679 type:complete len:196 (-) Transcript_39185:684-1271(-)